MTAILQRLADIQRSKFAMAALAQVCDICYWAQEGMLEGHEKDQFVPPYDTVAFNNNILAPVALIGWVQTAIIERLAFENKLPTQQSINDGIVPMLQEILAIRDPREYISKEILELIPLDISVAYSIFKRYIGLLQQANATWNGRQYSRDDKGDLGRIERTNVFSLLSLKTLMLDWDQVRAAAKLLIKLVPLESLTEEAVNAALQEYFVENNLPFTATAPTPA